MRITNISHAEELVEMYQEIIYNPETIKELEDTQQTKKPLRIYLREKTGFSSNAACTLCEGTKLGHERHNCELCVWRITGDDYGFSCSNDNYQSLIKCSNPEKFIELLRERIELLKEVIEKSKEFNKQQKEKE